MTNIHDKIDQETIKTIKEIRYATNKSDPEIMTVIFALACEWNSKYGKYYQTLKNADLPTATQVVAWKKTGACTKCGDTKEIKKPGKGPHAVTIECGNGHYKRWG